MSYTTFRTGVQTGYEAVTGIAVVLDYEPTSVQTTPLVYLVRDGGSCDYTAQGRLYTHRLLATLVIPWQDPEQAEETLTGLIQPLYEAFDADLSLGGTINGAVEVTSDEAGFEMIAGTLYRTCEFTVVGTELEC